MTALFTQVDLERRIGPQTLAQYTDDNRDKIADASIVTEILEEASDICRGILRGSFSDAQIATLAANDFAVRGALCDIGADLSARRRPALLSADGSTPYTTWRRNAEQTLERIAKLQRRAAGETLAGVNRNIRARPNRDPYPAIFVGTKANPRGPGGF
jgi:predicted aconitase